jgi:hypothetical protein
MTPYARTSDPATSGTCTPQTVGGAPFFHCDPARETAISGPVTLSSASPTVNVTLSGDILAQAVNQGRVWVGVGATVEGTTLGNVTLDFTNLVARVTLF